MKIRLLWTGKTKKDYYRSAIEDYAGRIRKYVPLEIVELRETPHTDRQRARRIRNEEKTLKKQRKAPMTVLIDSGGTMMSSEEFSYWLNKVVGEVDFLVGGPAGIQAEEITLHLSFGPMTLPHELARVVLLEQIYRALTIINRHPYHK